MESRQRTRMFLCTYLSRFLSPQMFISKFLFPPPDGPHGAPLLPGAPASCPCSSAGMRSTPWSAGSSGPSPTGIRSRALFPPLRLVPPTWKLEPLTLEFSFSTSPILCEDKLRTRHLPFRLGGGCKCTTSEGPAGAVAVAPTRRWIGASAFLGPSLTVLLRN